MRPSFYSPLRSDRGEIKVRQFSCENSTHVTVSSGVVNVDTNGIIKILLIRIYDAVFEVCLNFVLNRLLIAIEFGENAGGDKSREAKCVETFCGWM